MKTFTHQHYISTSVNFGKIAGKMLKHNGSLKILNDSKMDLFLVEYTFPTKKDYKKFYSSL